MTASLETRISPVMPVYNRSKIAFERGEGVYLYDTHGKRYLDFAAGIAVNSLGHCHPHVVSALTTQAGKLWHISNLYENPGYEKLAKRLTDASFADTIFFCNSGTEAVECGIKLVRKYHDDTGNPGRYRIITFKGAFHGRTLAAASASDRDKCIEGFNPPVEGFDNIAFGDIDLVRKTITPETAAILIEPIQGEGGVRVAPIEFLQALRQIADEHGLLLFFDEVQCGMGRTGKLFAYELAGITPDVMATAKGIGGGFPLGACFATEKAAIGMTYGTHGSTYGGNPLAMAVGNAIADIIIDPAFLQQVARLGVVFRKRLEGLVSNYPTVLKGVRGTGLMLGLELVPANKEFAEKLRNVGLLTVPAGENVLRILPPLTINESHINEAITLLEQVCKEYAA
jgi:acetylornithine/N-succinyldiaminopimelate aminotransferase